MVNDSKSNLSKSLKKYRVLKDEDGYPVMKVKVGDHVLDDLTGKVLKISHMPKKKGNNEWQGHWIIFNGDFKDARHEWEVSKVEKIKED